ncbi:hypothetical protein H9P43_009052 [Blastocladiella emersonii ATCC 22665]|nr:hypothetical protein H9P43_009052 [Blastocladiella emersonii ATCC 22665]
MRNGMGLYESDNFARLVLSIPCTREKVEVKPVPNVDLAQFRGDVALLVDGKLMTLRLPYASRVAEIGIDRRKRVVTVTVQKLAAAVSPMLGLGPLVPRFAPFPVPTTGPIVSKFLHAAAFASLEDLYTAAEWPAFASLEDFAFGAWNTVMLKGTLHPVFIYAANDNRACVVKFVEADNVEETIAVLFVHRPIVIPAQGKAAGITPALDISFVFAHPLQPRSASPATHAIVEQSRKRVQDANEACERERIWQFPIICAPECRYAIGEYLDFCSAAAPDRSLPEGPQNNPGFTAAMDAVKSDLKRALLLPLFPACPRSADE